MCALRWSTPPCVGIDVGNGAQVKDADRSTELLQRLADRVEVEDLILQYARDVDTKSWRSFELLFIDDCEVCYPSDDGPMRIAGRSELARFAEDALSGFPRTHHLMGNLQVSITGDTAKSTHYLQATHVRGGNREDHWDLGGWYQAEYVRTPAGWRFARLELDNVWEAGAESGG